MNIFYLDHDPKVAARWLIDKHVVKMILETAQMLCNTCWHYNVPAPYKPLPKQYLKHPSVQWVNESYENYLWLTEHGKALCTEYTQRYKKIHKCESIINWCAQQIISNMPRLGQTPIKLAIKKQYWDSCVIPGDPIQSYKNYYIKDKASFASWKQNKPEWWIE